MKWEQGKGAATRRHIDRETAKSQTDKQTGRQTDTRCIQRQHHVEESDAATA